MAKQLQLRRGTTAEHASFTGAVGEVTVDSDKDTIVVHDGYTVGGIPMLRQDVNNLADQTIPTNKIIKGTANQVLVTNAAGTGVEFAYKGVVQAGAVSANYNFGSVGNANDYDLTWLAVTVTAKANGSKWFLSARLPTDDTNSSSYGIGMGFKVQINGGTTYYITHAAQHEDYSSAAADTYSVARSTIIWDPAVTHGSTPILTINSGDTVKFTPHVRFNNANGQYFNGNDVNYHNQWMNYMEIAA